MFFVRGKLFCFRCGALYRTESRLRSRVRIL
jgi:hypothetical protein